MSNFDIVDQDGKTVARCHVGGPDKNYVFGVCPVELFVNLPPDALRLRVRMRNNEFAEVFIRRKTGISRHHILDRNGRWTPGPEIARNDTLPALAAA